MTRVFVKIGPIIHVVPCINWKIYRSLKINIDKNRRRQFCVTERLFFDSQKKKKKNEKQKNRKRKIIHTDNGTTKRIKGTKDS